MDVSRNIILFLIFPFLLSITFSGCENRSPHPEAVKQAAALYRESGDYQSLERIVAYLHPGMSETEVKTLLGEPVYSPIEGQYYYTSDSLDPETHFVLGLVVNYVRKDSTDPASEWILKEFELMPIGE